MKTAPVAAAVRLATCLFAFSPILTVPPAAAAGDGEPWYAPAFAAEPADLLRAAEAAGGTAEDSAIVLLNERSFSYDEQGRETSVQRLVYRILSPQAVDGWSTVECSWEPWHQQRPRLRARVITPDGAVHTLDPATIAESPLAESGEQVFDDRRLLHAPLPAVRAGAVVEEEIEVADAAPWFDAGVVRYEVVVRSVPVRLARVTVEAPAAMPLRWAVRLLPGSAPREVVEGGRRRLEIEVRDLAPRVPAEPGLPSDVPASPYISFSTGSSWAAVAGRYARIVDEAIAGSDLSTLLREAGPGGSRAERIGSLLALVHREVRYTGLELGAGSIIPRSPAETLGRKYGDCKDKSVLLVALLRAAGIPAHLALLSVGDRVDVEPELPGLGDFDHAIVYVPGEPALWIDPTDPWSRAGDLPVPDQGRLALIASPETTALVRTPESVAADNRKVEDHEVVLADLGKARLTITAEHAGAFERDLRSVFGEAPAEALREFYSAQLTSVYLAQGLDGLDHGDAADFARRFRVRLEARQCERGITDTAQAVAALLLDPLLAELPEELLTAGEARKGDYAFPFPFVREARYRVVAPDGFVLRELPAPRTRTLGTATLTEEYAVEKDGAVVAGLRLDTGKRRLSPGEFEALRTAVVEAYGTPPALLWFDQSGETHLEAGRVREALEEFGRLVAARPGQALPCTRRARALLAGGMGEAARQEARRAVELEPGSARAHVVLGWVLEHDLVGRRFGKGSDRPGALTAYRKAKELDPENAEARASLAILLEHDERGVRYGSRADVGAAIEEYRMLRETQDSDQFANNHLVALLYAGRFGECRELLSGLDDSPLRAQVAVVATAALDGPAAALREAERRFPDPQARLRALAGAAQDLVRLRRYGEAAALLERAGWGSPQAAALLATADQVRRTRRHEEVTIPLDQPAGVARRLMVAAIKADSEMGRALLTEEAARAEGEFTAESLEEVWRGAAADQDIPKEVGIDLALANLRETVEGDDASGYRVRFELVADESPSQWNMYVVRRGGEYRVLASGEDTDLLGGEALRRLEAGDLAGARQWLDWAHVETGTDTPFAAIWSRGAEAPAEKARCAAGLLLSTSNPETEPLLLRCRAGAASPAERTAFERRLASIYLDAKRPADALALAPGLAEADPEMAFRVEADALAALARWQDLRRRAEERLSRLPEDARALTALSRVALNVGDYAALEAAFDRLVAAGEAKAVHYNDVAWAALFHGRVGERDIERAQRAVTLGGSRSHAQLHTLAALYAETGRAAEAYQVLVQAMAADGGDEPTPADWYVFGRLAEEYGLADLARGYYARALEGEDDETGPSSTPALARKRLAVLGGAPAQSAGR